MAILRHKSQGRKVHSRLFAKPAQKNGRPSRGRPSPAGVVRGGPPPPGGTPSIARSPPLDRSLRDNTARSFSRAPRSGKPMFHRPQACPRKSALIPDRSAKQSTDRCRPQGPRGSARRQTACKPGSVPPSSMPEGGDGHSSATLVTERLMRPTRAAARRHARRARSFGRPAAPTWSCSRWGFPCRRRCRRRGALLPHHFTLAAARTRPKTAAVYFLWHFP